MCYANSSILNYPRSRLVHIQEMTVHRHNVPIRLVGSLDGPSKTIVVEPLSVPAKQPRQPAVAPEPEPERSKPAPTREPVPTR
jgi:hypothetical protein